MSLDIPTKDNPSNGPEARFPDRKRVPMSVPQPKLSVPDVPGYHLHWMLGTPDRLEQAKRAGYSFVAPEEVDVANVGLGSGPDGNGSTDLGSLVTHVAGGGAASNGQATRLVLMKIPLQFWEEDQKLLEAQSDKLAAALQSGQMSAAQVGESAGDRALRYVDKNRTRTMFDKRRG